MSVRLSGCVLSHTGLRTDHPIFTWLSQWYCWLFLPFLLPSYGYFCQNVLFASWFVSKAFVWSMDLLMNGIMVKRNLMKRQTPYNVHHLEFEARFTLLKLPPPWVVSSKLKWKCPFPCKDIRQEQSLTLNLYQRAGYWRLYSSTMSKLVNFIGSRVQTPKTMP